MDILAAVAAAHGGEPPQPLTCTVQMTLEEVNYISFFSFFFFLLFFSIYFFFSLLEINTKIYSIIFIIIYYLLFRVTIFDNRF